MDQSQRGLSPQTSKSPSHQNQQQRTKEFQLDFFLQKKFIPDDLQSILQDAQSKYSIKSIHLTPKNQIPELEGQAFTIDDPVENKMSDKCDAAFFIIQQIEEKYKQQINIILLIPEGVVSFLIGSKGTQIGKLIEETQAKITVNQPIAKYPPRTVKISGDSNKINCALRAITKKMQERGVSYDDHLKVPEALNPAKVNSKAKLIFSSQMLSNIMKYRNDIQKKYQVLIKSKESDDIRLSQKQRLKRDEKILQVSGVLSEVQEGLSSLIKKVQESVKNEFEIKIVMPASFASKLIGAKGCQIRELATKSKGAQIKVLSDKDETDPDFDCIVQIAGNLQNKQEATKLILQQIECFKNGGPILESGKFLNDNYVQTFQPNNVKEEVPRPKRQKSSSESDHHSRSRSQSRKKHKHIRKRSNERRSISSSSNSRRRERAKILQTTIIVPTGVIDILEKYRKLNEYSERYNVEVSVEDIRGKYESNVKLKGKQKEILIVIEEILNEQYRIQRK